VDGLGAVIKPSGVITGFQLIVGVGFRVIGGCLILYIYSSSQNILHIIQKLRF